MIKLLLLREIVIELLEIFRFDSSEMRVLILKLSRKSLIEGEASVTFSSSKMLVSNSTKYTLLIEISCHRKRLRVQIRELIYWLSHIWRRLRKDAVLAALAVAHAKPMLAESIARGLTHRLPSRRLINHTWAHTLAQFIDLFSQRREVKDLLLWFCFVEDWNIFV